EAVRARFDRSEGDTDFRSACSHRAAVDNFLIDARARREERPDEQIADVAIEEGHLELRAIIQERTVNAELALDQPLRPDLWIADRGRLNEPCLAADLTAVRKSEEALAVVRLVPRLTHRAAELDLADPAERPNDPIGRAEARERVELLRIAVHAAALGPNSGRQQHLLAEGEEV